MGQGVASRQASWKCVLGGGTGPGSDQDPALRFMLSCPWVLTASGFSTKGNIFEYIPFVLGSANYVARPIP